LQAVIAYPRLVHGHVLFVLVVVPISLLLGLLRVYLQKRDRELRQFDESSPANDLKRAGEYD
jgi:hypothetical protein